MRRISRLRGLREHRDVDPGTRNLIFTGATMRTCEPVLRRFLDSCPSAQHLKDLGKREFRAFMDKAIADGLSAKKPKRYGSALAKGALVVTGPSLSMEIAGGAAYETEECEVAGLVSAPVSEGVRVRVKRVKSAGEYVVWPGSGVLLPGLRALRVWRSFGLLFLRVFSAFSAPAVRKWGA